MSLQKRKTAKENKLQLIRDLLAMGPAAVPTIAQVISLTPRAARNYISMLRLAGEVHIDRWEQPHPGWPWRPLFALGAGEDALSPSPTVVWKDSPTVTHVAPGATHRDPLVAALFGAVDDGRPPEKTKYPSYVHRLDD